MGFFASLLGVGITNALMAARQMLDPSFVPLNPPQVRRLAGQLVPQPAHPTWATWPYCPNSLLPRHCRRHCGINDGRLQLLLPPWRPDRPQHQHQHHLLHCPSQDVLVMSAAYGSYMASSSNLRYQVRRFACLPSGLPST